MKYKTTGNNSTRTIVLLCFEGAAALDITGPHEVFAVASHLAQGSAAPPYRLVLLADQAGPFRAALGLGMVAEWRSGWWANSAVRNTPVKSRGCWNIIPSLPIR